MRPCLLLLACLPALTLAAPAVPAVAEPASDPVVAAQEAYRSRDLAALEKLLPRTVGHLLADYPVFWSLELRLGTALHAVSVSEVHAFLARTGDGPLGERLRADWLKALAQQQAWSDLLADGKAYAGSDPDVVCGLSSARVQAGQADPLEPVRAVWLSGRTTPATCEPVFTRLLASGRLTADDVLARFGLALQADNLPLARSLQPLLGAEVPAVDLALVALGTDPAVWLDHVERHGATRALRLAELYAIGHVARTDLARARTAWERVAPALPPAERAQGWARIGVQAMQKLDPQALADFRHCREGGGLTDADLEWWARAALRAGAWPDLLVPLGLMSEAMAGQPAWRYWQARALRQQGRRDEATTLLQGLARDNDFYGQLAQEELGQHPQLPAGATPEGEEVDALRERPGMQRALALFNLGMAPEAVKEWGFVVKGSGDRQHWVAAELARQVGWYDRMISSAERSGALADASLRYPLPYRDSFRAHSREQKLDEAWVYGLVRQESRFLAEARSRVGATGLMQLMPATARWVATRMRMRDFRFSQVSEADTNLQMGTYYLRTVLDTLGHPVLATAGYNAGPTRVRRWLAAQPLEGAVFCETIPLTETRDYVKRVMANASLYAQRLGLPARSLHARLGTLRAEGAAPATDVTGPDAGPDANPESRSP